MQWTAYGISGIAVFQVSRYAVRALEEGEQVRAVQPDTVNGNHIPDSIKEHGAVLGTASGNKLQDERTSDRPASGKEDDLRVLERSGLEKSKRRAAENSK